MTDEIRPTAETGASFAALIGRSRQSRVIVEGTLLTSFWDGAPAVDVLATPSLVSLFERVATEVLDDAIPAGSVSVGTAVSIEHYGAVGPGEWVDIRAEVVSTDRRRVTFELSATGAGGPIAHGTHSRAVVDRERFVAAVAGRKR